MSWHRWALLLCVVCIVFSSADWWLKAPVLVAVLWIPTVRLLRVHGFIRDRVES